MSESSSKTFLTIHFEGYIQSEIRIILVVKVFGDRLTHDDDMIFDD